MKKNALLITVLVLFFSVCAVNTSAQFEKLKKKVQKGVKTLEEKTDISGGVSKVCINHAKNIDNQCTTIEKYLNEDNLNAAKNYLQNFQNYIEKAKKDNCPQASKWEGKYKALKDQCQEKFAGSNPLVYLILGVNKSDKAQIDKALEKGADINGFDDWENPLLNAVKDENLNMVQYLVEKGADVNVNRKVHEGIETPLYCSVKQNNTEITKYLLSKGQRVSHNNYCGPKQ